MADPLTTISYRIQSLDYQTYLELLAPQNTNASQAPVGLRPLKDNQKQHWRFEKKEGTNSYYIRSVANNALYLWFSSSTCSTFPKSSVQPFEVSIQTDSSSFLYTNSGNYKYMLQAQDTNNSVLVTTSATGLDNQRWKIVPVTSLPVNNDLLRADRYRIRSFNGTSLLTMPSGETVGQAGVYVKHQVPKNDHQLWDIAATSAGRFTITNVGNYSLPVLGCSAPPSAVGGKVTGLSRDKSFEWELQSVGGFAWSIRVPEKNFSLGFADMEVNDEDLVTLRNSDSTPSQIWFLEKFIPLGQDEIHAKREVEAGDYILQSARDPAKFINFDSNQLTFSSGNNVVSAKFTLKYKDDTSPRFTLTYAVNKTKSIKVADQGDGTLGFARNATEFVLLEKGDGDPGYYICLADSGYHRKVVSGRLVTNEITDKNVLAIDNMAAGEPVQMWNFIEAPAT